MVPVILFHPIYFEEKNVKTSLFAKSSSSNLTLNWETVYLVELNQALAYFPLVRTSGLCNPMGKICRCYVATKLLACFGFVDCKLSLVSNVRVAITQKLEFAVVAFFYLFFLIFCSGSWQALAC